MGWIDEKDKRELYQNAKAFVFPGIEDFGITPLESISSGTPVIAYKKGGILETVTEETGVLFDSQTADALKRAVTAFEKKPFIIDKKPAYFDMFSPENFIRQFKDIVHETLDAFQKGRKSY